jgi:alpha-galactosidase
MTYGPNDKQPSVFLLKENERQTMLTVFNWTEAQRSRAIDFKSLGLKKPSEYTIVEEFGDQGCCSIASDVIDLVEKPHSVRMLKLIDKSVPAVPPAFEISSAAGARAGETLTFSAAASSASQAPVLTCHWDFGDGTSLDGMQVTHAFTHAGRYEVQAAVTGLDATTNRKTVPVSISGEVPTRFEPAEKMRAE